MNTVSDVLLYCGIAAQTVFLLSIVRAMIISRRDS